MAAAPKQLACLQDPLFTQRFVRIDVAQKQEDYQRVQTITKEIAEVKNQLSQLNLFWLDEQRQIIEHLKEEILALNKEKDAKNVQRGNLESRIHSWNMRSCRKNISGMRPSKMV